MSNIKVYIHQQNIQSQRLSASSQMREENNNQTQNYVCTVEFNTWNIGSITLCTFSSLWPSLSLYIRCQVWCSTRGGS